MQPQNQVISPFRAIVNGKSTPLSGCDNRECGRPCLRKDEQLHTRATHGLGSAACQHHIQK